MAIELPHPRTNAQLFGFSAIENELAAGFRTNTLHHSLMLTGAKGIGKATLAYRLARFILSGGADLRESESHPFSLFAPSDPEPTAGGGDGALYMPESHGIFKRVAGNSHADLLSIEPAYDAKKGVYKEEIQAEVAREIGGFLSLTAAESQYRVVVIDAADQLNEKAANALLKSIEEPPEKAFVILVCHNPLSVLSTIRSRCRVIKLAIPDLTAFGAVLSQRMPSIDMSDYGALHALSHGSAGFAIQLAAFDGVGLYEQVALQLAGTHNSTETLQLAVEMSASKHADAWYVSKHVLLTVMERALSKEQAIKQPIFAQEARCLDALQTRLAAAGLFDLRDKTIRLLRDTDALNLDHTQALVRVLSAA